MAYSLERQRCMLVTGGAGFLGSHLCDRLIEQGHAVIVVDNLFTGDKRNIRHLEANGSFEFIRHDINFPLYLEVDAIFNFACPASPVHYQRDPVQTTKTNVQGAINMLGLAKRLNVPILQASTSEVYGDPAMHPQREDYWGHVNPIGRRACYDEGKRCAETLFFDYHRQHDLQIKVVRIFNRHSPDDIQIRGNRTTAPSPRELCSHCSPHHPSISPDFPEGREGDESLEAGLDTADATFEQRCQAA